METEINKYKSVFEYCVYTYTIKKITIQSIHFKETGFSLEHYTDFLEKDSILNIQMSS